MSAVMSSRVTGKASRSLIKRVRQLQQKKYRTIHAQFVVEGKKAIQDFVENGYEPVHLLRTDELRTREERKDENERSSGVMMMKSKSNASSISSSRWWWQNENGAHSESIELVTSADMQDMTGLKTACDSLAVFSKREDEYLNAAAFSSSSSSSSSFSSLSSRKDELLDVDVNLALDSVRDPGNLGTIIRICDWFGLRHLILSHDCCDCYNPKVVRATSGSLARVKVHYVESLSQELERLEVPVIGASAKGSSIYASEFSFPSSGVLVVGNEGQGLSEEVTQVLDQTVSIPSYGEDAESLNVAVATGILISEIKRNGNASTITEGR